MNGPERENPEPGRCCCVIVEPETEAECMAITSGPDEPFCISCADRHVDDQRVIEGIATVIARIPRKEEA